MSAQGARWQADCSGVSQSSDTPNLGTRARAVVLRHPGVCASDCRDRTIRATRRDPVECIVVNVWADRGEHELPHGQEVDTGAGDHWLRTEIYHPGCYQGQYGPPGRVESSVAD